MGFLFPTCCLVCGMAGWLAGCLLAAMALQDTIKIRLQTQVAPGPGQPLPYSGMMDCIRKTWAQEGLSGLYRGAASPLAGALVHNAGLFLSNGQAKRFVSGGVDRPLTLTEFLYAGMIAGFAISIVEGPIDLLKIKMQAQRGEGEYKGVFDCAAKITKQYGIKGLYQGITSVVLRNTLAFGGYFWGFEAAQRALATPGQQASLGVCFVAGGFAGFCFWGVIYPTDIIKSRMQSAPSDPKLRLYSTTWDCFQKTLAEGGVAALFKGYVPAVVRAVPVNASIFLGYTATKRALSGASDGGAH